MIPKGSLREQYLPNGLVNVVSSSDLGERGICQNPELASSFVNTFATFSLPSVCPTEGRLCFSFSIRHHNHAGACRIVYFANHAEVFHLFEFTSHYFQHWN